MRSRLAARAASSSLSAQALYHYFDSRDALFTALIEDGFTAAAAAIAAGRESGGDDRRERLRGAALAYRQWAVAEPHVYRLLYGDAVTKHHGPGAGLRPGIELAQAIFGGWTAERYAAMDIALGGDGAELRGDGFAALPATIRMLLARWWGQLHGLMNLELLGHLYWATIEPAVIYEDSVNALAEHIIEITDGY